MVLCLGTSVATGAVTATVVNSVVSSGTSSITSHTSTNSDLTTSNLVTQLSAASGSSPAILVLGNGLDTSVQQEPSLTTGGINPASTSVQCSSSSDTPGWRCLSFFPGGGYDGFVECTL